MFIKRYLIFLTIAISGVFTSCERKPPVTDPVETIVATDMKLTFREITDKYYPNGKFYFGCISFESFLNSGNSQAPIFHKEFSYNTPENQFKQQVVYKMPNDAWNDRSYKALLKMARNAKQVVRAHAPISPQCSNWALEDNRTAAELESVMTYFTTKMCQELEANKDIVKWMDVVNETVATGNIIDSQSNGYVVGDWFGPLTGTSSWENPWLRMGQENVTELKVPKYIELAFKIATEKAPDIKLLYNHHGRMEAVPWEKVKKTILYLRSKGYRVDAVGWQAHLPLGFEKNYANIQKINEIIDWCYANKLEFHITELDVKLGNVDISTFKTKENEIAATYSEIVKVALRKIGKGVVGINCWSFNDRANTGVGGATAGLYDVNNQPNKCIFAIKEAIIRNAN